MAETKQEAVAQAKEVVVQAKEAVTAVQQAAAEAPPSRKDVVQEAVTQAQETVDKAQEAVAKAQGDAENEWFDNGKLRLANTARLMCDNQRVLNTTHASDRARRDLGQRIEEWDFERISGSLSAAQESTGGEVKKGIDYPEDDMRINIDSPVTINHHYPPKVTQPASQPVADPIDVNELAASVASKIPKIPAVAPAGLGTLAKVLIGGALATSGVGTIASVAALLKPNPAPIVQPGSDTTLQVEIPEADRVPK